MPRQKNNGLKVSISARIDPALKKRLTALAKSSDCTVSQYIETVLAERANLSGPAEEPKAPRSTRRRPG
jgi:predicted HicB family RNase H-like nuclease